MAQPQPPGGQQGNNVPGMLIKPAQIDGLPISPDMKQKYKNGLVQLWQVLTNSPPGSQQHADAEKKIHAASVQIMQQIGKGTRPAGVAGGQQPAPGTAQRPPSGGPAPSQQPSQQVQTGGVASAVQQPQPGQQQQGNPQAQMLPQSRQELNSIKINVPQQYMAQGEQAMQRYRQQWAARASALLSRRDGARSRGSNLQKMRDAGQGNPVQMQADMEKCRTEMQAAHQGWEQMKQSNARNGAQAAGGMAQQAAAGQAQAQSAGSDMPQRPPSSQLQTPSQGQGDAKSTMDQQPPTSISPAQPQPGFPPQQQQQQQAQSVQQQQATPQSATRPQSAQNFAQANPIAQQQQQQQRPGMNAQQMMQAQQNMANSQQQQQQQQQPSQQPQAPPQLSGPQRPQALSHQAAMSQASFARQDAAQQQQHQPQQQQPQQATQPGQQQPQGSNIPNGLALNRPQSSATNQTPPPPSAYAHAQMPQPVSSNTKFPIPKQLNLDPLAQGPVPGPASRPTFSNSGMMGQPGIQRAGQFTLEGEGDRVLSKRKLDELVRQVTGSADGAESGGGLTPEVEEAVLTVTDNFIDNLIVSSCRLAKLRSGQTLDIRDIQIVLERNYGIRIPGYALDEVRTVRKFQPAEGWRNKMQAVQAGKVMGANAGKDA